jgi:hypothetical protein
VLVDDEVAFAVFLVHLFSVLVDGLEVEADVRRGRIGLETGVSMRTHGSQLLRGFEAEAVEEIAEPGAHVRLSSASAVVVNLS